MEVKTVTISMGRTVNRGNFENIRYDVSITATLTPEEFEQNGAEDVELAVREELVWALSNDLEDDLDGIRWQDFEGNPLSGAERIEKAKELSPIFRHMCAVNEELAGRLLLAQLGVADKSDDPINAIDGGDAAEIEVVTEVVTEVHDES